jgi:hypothetical protein
MPHNPRLLRDPPVQMVQVQLSSRLLLIFIAAGSNANGSAGNGPSMPLARVQMAPHLLQDPRLQLMREQWIPRLLLDPGVLMVQAQAAGAGADGTASRAAVRLGLRCC